MNHRTNLVFSCRQPETRFEVMYEGTENELFWKCVGGKRQVDQSADFLQYGRLFRLSNDQGYFCASEKCSDFCQDDLADDDVMMLDTGNQVSYDRTFVTQLDSLVLCLSRDHKGIDQSNLRPSDPESNSR